MAENGFNMSLRKFLKRVGVTSQDAIAEATRAARDNGSQEAVEARMVLYIDGREVHSVEGKIALKDDE